MKVAHILRKYIPEEWGGTETAMQQLAMGLTHSDVKSIVFCPDAPSETNGFPVDDPHHGAVDPLIAAGCALRRYRACMPVWGLSAQERTRVVALGGNLISFDLGRKLAREPDLDVIHCHVIGRLGGIARRIARRRHIPFVVTIHGGVLDLSEETKQSLQTPSRGTLEWGRIFGLLWGSRRVLSDADMVITCNGNEAALIKARHPDIPVITHPHGIDFDKYREDHTAAARKAYPRITGKKVLLCVARIDVVKNQTWLISELPVILERHPDALLVLAGATTSLAYCEALQTQIKAAGLEHSVLLTGGIPPGDPCLIGLLQLARAMVLPSKAEPFGLVILEGWAAGVPVFASNTSGARSLINHGRNGWLFDLDDPASFHANLDRTLADPEMARSISEAATLLVREKYDARKLAGDIKDIYSGLIEDSHRRHHRKVLTATQPGEAGTKGGR